MTSSTVRHDVGKVLPNDNQCLVRGRYCSPTKVAGHPSLPFQAGRGQSMYNRDRPVPADEETMMLAVVGDDSEVLDCGHGAYHGTYT